MKVEILSTDGKKNKEIKTDLFESPIRKDIINKVVEAERIWQPYSNAEYAGMNRSASGILTKRRKVWKSDRGKGLSRIPRMIMSRRGTQFNWIGAIIPSARGGRRAHPPKASVNLKKINKKEMIKGLLSSLSYVSDVDSLKEKYYRIKDKKIDVKLPFVVEENVLGMKSKDFVLFLRKILGELFSVAIKEKSVRAGKGKMRGRKYKMNAGMLFVIGKDEDFKIKGIEVVRTNELLVSDLARNGARLTMFSENAVKDLEKLK